MAHRVAVRGVHTITLTKESVGRPRGQGVYAGIARWRWFSPTVVAVGGGLVLPAQSAFSQTGQNTGEQCGPKLLFHAALKMETIFWQIYPHNFYRHMIYIKVSLQSAV
jgi:hypothetical protein